MRTRSVVVLALAASLTTCRLDKLVNPAAADKLAVSPATVQRSANVGSTNPREVILRITHADDAALALTWSATKTAAWVELSKSAGTAPDSVVVTLRADTLSEVPHQDTIVFTSTQASRDIVRVPIAFDILPPAPELVLSVTSYRDSAFAGSALAPAFKVFIDNAGSIGLTWTAAADAAWLTLSKAGGGAPPQDSMVVTLTPGTLPAGTHEGTVTVTAPGAVGDSAVVPVTFKIKPCAELGVVPDAVIAGVVTRSDCGAPRRPGSLAKLYSVTASVGDTLSFRLSSADFDEHLVLTSASGTVLNENDECSDLPGTACILKFVVPAAGPYVIEATTTAPGDTGTFTLSVVKERAPSTPSPIGQFHGDSATAIGVGVTTTENVAVFKGTLNDPNLGDSVRLEIELIGAMSGTTTNSSAFVPVTSGGVSVAIRATGLVENEAYHWRARTCDQTNRCSPWLGFGGNPETASDFFVNAVPETPTLTGAPDQFGPGGGAIPVGGGTGGTLGGSVTVTFKAAVTDPDPGDLISIEVEYKRTNAALDEDPGSLARGSGVASSATASVGVSFPVPLILTDDYHWRARACDQTNRCSGWTPFGGNSDVVVASTDFHVP